MTRKVSMVEMLIRTLEHMLIEDINRGDSNGIKSNELSMASNGGF